MTLTVCKACNLEGDAAGDLRKWIDEGYGGDRIARFLRENHDIALGASSINRHRRNHKDRPQETLLGVVAPPPSGNAKVEFDDNGGEAVTRAYTDVEDPEKLISNTEQILRDHGINPDVFEVVGNIRISRWEVAGNWNTAFRFRFERKGMGEGEDQVDLPALYAAARLASPKPKPKPSKRATVAVYADPQLGKTGRRGGTKETIERSMVVREKLASLLETRKPEHAVLMDAGDGIEGFNSGGNPMFTNDLSFPAQLDIYSTELFEFVNLLHRYAPTTLMGVCSNHSAWRNGKQQLGNPQDDFGLFVHKQVEKVTRAAGMDVDYVAPADYDESVAYEIFGTTLGLVHGNQFNPGKAIDWWEKQTFGAGAITKADIMVHGHYHTFTAGVAGRNPHSQRQRWCFGAPTLDNGSDWYRQIAGRDSDPGMLVFDVTENGFDLSSLVILDCE